MNPRQLAPENRYPENTAWYIEVSLSTGHIRRGSAVAIRLRKSEDQHSKAYLLTCRHVICKYNTIKEQQESKHTKEVEIKAIHAFRHYTGYAIDASRPVEILETGPSDEDNKITIAELLNASNDWVLLDFGSNPDAVAYQCIAENSIRTEDGAIEIIGFPGGKEAFALDHIVRATCTNGSITFRQKAAGIIILNGGGTRSGVSGGGVFQNHQFIGIHRLRDDDTQQLELVTWEHIRSRLREQGYEAILDTFSENAPSNNRRIHSLGKRMSDLQSVRETQLYRLLDSPNDADLTESVCLVCDEAMNQTRMCQSEAGAPFIDWQHGIYTAEAMYATLPESTIVDLRKHEIAILLLTAFLHDLPNADNYVQLMNLTSEDAYKLHRSVWERKHENYARTLKYGTKEEREQLDLACRFDYFAAKNARNAHLSVTQFLRFSESASRFPPYLSDLLVRIVKLHHCESIPDEERTFIDSTPTINGEPICVAFILATLKIADRLSFSVDLLPRSVFREIRPGGRVTLQKWREHFLPSNTEVRFENGSIALVIPCEETEYLDAGMEYAANLEQSVRNAIRLLNSSNPPPKRSLNPDIEIRTDAIAPKDNRFLRIPLEFHLDRQAISDLLLTQELYQDKSLCIRELVQNAVDACTLAKEIRQRNTVKDNYEPVIRLEHGVEHGREYLICEDNGSGMSLEIVQNYLTRIGKSYYQSDEFRKRGGDPTHYIARYGIGFASCFMLGDRIEIETVFLSENGVLEAPLRIEVLGIDGKMTIRCGTRNSPGTSVKIWIREQPSSELPHDKLDLIQTLSLFCSNSPVRIDAVEMIGDKKHTRSFSRPEKLVPPEIPHLVSANLFCVVSDIVDPNGEVEGWVRTFIPLNKVWRQILNHLRREILKSDPPKTVRDCLNWLFARYFPVNSPRARINNWNHEISVSTELETEDPNDYRDRWSEPYVLRNRILFDGMLVSTTEVPQFGRHGCFYRRFVRDELLANVTGSTKGKLTPARTPPTRLDTDSSWNAIRRSVLSTRAQNWIKIANARVLSWRDFWEYIYDYRVEIAYCTTPEAVNQLAFPCHESWRTIVPGKAKRLYVSKDFFSGTSVLRNGWPLGLRLHVGRKEDRSTSDWLDKQIVKTLALHSTITRVGGKLALNFDGQSEPYLSAFDRVLTNGDPVLNTNRSSELWCVPFTGEIQSYFGMYGWHVNAFPLINQSHPLVSLYLGSNNDDTVPHSVKRFADLFIRYSLGDSSVYFGSKASDVILDAYHQQIRTAVADAFNEAYDDMKRHEGMLPPYKIKWYREELTISERRLRSGQ